MFNALLIYCRAKQSLNTGDAFRFDDFKKIEFNSEKYTLGQRLSVFYRGLIPFFIAVKLQILAIHTGQWSDILMQSKYQTPLMFMMSTIITHPLYLVSARVHFHKFARSEEYEMRNCNSWRAAKNLWANHGGFRGLYKGFVPNAIVQTMLFLPFLFFSKHMTSFQPEEVVVIEESISDTYPNE